MIIIQYSSNVLTDVVGYRSEYVTYIRVILARSFLSQVEQYKRNRHKYEQTRSIVIAIAITILHELLEFNNKYNLKCN